MGSLSRRSWDFITFTSPITLKLMCLMSTTRDVFGHVPAVSVSYAQVDWMSTVVLTVGSTCIHLFCVVRGDTDARLKTVSPCGVWQERLWFWGDEVRVAVPSEDGQLVFERLKDVQSHHWSRAYSHAIRKESFSCLPSPEFLHVSSCSRLRTRPIAHC